MTTTEHEKTWPYIAGRMQVFAEVLVQLADSKDDLGDAEVRRRIELYAAAAREALAEIDPNALAQLDQRGTSSHPA